MNKYFTTLIFILFSLVSYGQTTYTSSPPIDQYNSCPANNDCGNGMFLGNTIHMKTNSISGNVAVFTIKKCYGGTFNQGGTLHLKEEDECSSAVEWTNYSSGGTEKSITYTFPSSFTSGSRKYYIVIESDDTYKYRAGYITITASTPECPDLIVPYKTVTSPAPQGSDIVIRCKVKNDGNGDAGSSTLKYYLSTNTSWSSGDTYIGYDNISSLTSGSTSGIESITYTLLSSLSPGTYYILYKADVYNDVDECCSGCESNVFYKSFVVTEACPDLEVTSYNVVDSHIYPGEDIELTATITNNGNSTAGASTLYYYLDNSPGYNVPNVNDAIGSDAISSLSVNASDNENFTKSTLSSASPGTYYIKWQADGDEDVGECGTNGEDNNVEWDFLFIDPVPGSFLELNNDMDINPNPVVRNNSATFSAEIINNSTGNWNGDLRFELLDGGGNIFNIIDNDWDVEIEPGSSNTYTFSHTSPNVTTPAGNYKLQLSYSDDDGATWTPVNQGSYTNPLNFCIIEDNLNITITSPIDGYAYPYYNTNGQYESLTINWTSSGFSGSVNIEYHNPDTGVNTLIEADVDNTGTYIWNYDASVNPDNYKIKMYPTETCGAPFYSGEFIILSNATLQNPSDDYSYSSPPSSITYSWLPNNPTGNADYEIRLKDITTNNVILNYVTTDTESSHYHPYSYEAGHSYRWIIRAKAGTNNETIESASFEFDVDVGSPNLKLNSAIDIVPSSPTQGGSMTVTSVVKNFGSGSWSGNLVLQLLNGDGSYNNDLDLDNNLTISAGSTHTLYFNTNNVTSDPGNYKIRIQQQNNGSGSWVTTNGNGYDNPKDFVIQSGSSCEDSYEPNETKATASSGVFSSLGTSNYNHSISDANININGDIDYFKVDYTENGTVTVSLTNLPENYELELWDDNNYFAYSNNTGTSDETVSYDFIGSGYFYIKIYGNNNNNSSCDDYTLTLDWDAEIADCSYFSDLPNSGDDVEAYEAAVCLCNLGYIIPQDYDEDGTEDEVNPDANIYRADLAKIVYLAIYQGSAANPAANFPVPFADLQYQYTGDYYDYAIALSYLEYGDGITPFSQNFINFYPYNNIPKKYALKVILEAYNIEPDTTDGGTIQQVNHGEDAYGYVHKAWDMDLITDPTANANTNVLRRNIFIIMHRLLSYDTCPDCDESCLDPNPQTSDYFIPPNTTPTNMGRTITEEEGFFTHQPNGGLFINSRKIPISFNIFYSSYLAEISDGFTPVTPLGKGWSHSYNAYVIKAPQWTAPDGTVHPDRYAAFWPSGGVDYYDENSMPLSEANYDTILLNNSVTIKIRTKNQVTYWFTKYSSSGTITYYLTKIEDRNLNKIQISYELCDQGYRIDEITGTTGKKLYFYHSGDLNRITSILDPSGGRTLQFGYDDYNNLESFTNAKGYTENYDYGGSPQMNLLTEVTRPEGNKLINHYDAGTRQFKHTRILDDSNTEIYRFDVDVTHHYDISNPYIESVITDINSTTNNTYNPNGTLADSYTNVNGVDIYTTPTYNDPNNEFLPTNIQYGSSTENIDLNYVYYSDGNVHKALLPNGSFHEYTYNDKNDILTYKDPNGNTYTYGYDSDGNLETITNPLGHTTTYTINSYGQVTNVENPEEINTGLHYNSAGNLFHISQPLSINSYISYDNLNRPKTTTNPKSQVTEFDYDNNDLITKKTRFSTGGNVITEYFYDMNNNLTEVENALDNSTFYNYDNGDALVSTTFGNDTKTFEYYKDGKFKKYIKPDGTELLHTYDEQDKLENDGYASYIYDDLGNVKKVTQVSSGNDIDMTYDINNRLETVTDYYGKTVTYDYDNNGNVTKITYPGGFVVNYFYDDANRLEYVKWDSDTKVVEYTYLDDNRLNRIDYPNGSYCTFTYDDAGRMTGKSWKKSGGEIINSYTFVLDDLGNHESENKTEPYGVPSLYSMLKSTTYNSENEPNNGTFDENGNQTAGNGMSSTWNIVDMPVMISGDTYEYDGLKLRRKTIIDGVTKKYVWDIRGMGNILAEMNNTNSIEGYYIHGLGLAAKVIGGQSYYYHDDFRGSVIAITNQSQNIVNKYNYDPFGYVTNQFETITNPFKYVGVYGVMGDKVDRHYMRARYMDSKSGRFISEDPVWNENLYNYVGNDPIDFIDKLGKTRGFPNYEIVPSFGGQKVFTFGPLITEIKACALCIEPVQGNDDQVVKLTAGIEVKSEVGVSSDTKSYKNDFNLGLVNINYGIVANFSIGAEISQGASLSYIMDPGTGLPSGFGGRLGPLNYENYIYIDIADTNQNISNKYGRDWGSRLEKWIIQGFSNRAF